MQKSIEFVLKSSADGLDELRAKSNQVLKNFNYPESTIQTQMAVISALVAGADNFQDLNSRDLGMAVLVEMKTDSITVEVKKSISDSAFRRLNRLDLVIQGLRGNPEPYETYGGGHASEADEAAFAEIAYATGAVIDFYVNEDNILNLSAVCSVVS